MEIVGNLINNVMFNMISCFEDAPCDWYNNPQFKVIDYYEYGVDNFIVLSDCNGKMYKA